MDGSPKFLALNREASLALEAAATGLDAISKAHFGAPGIYFKAFFNLSTALERIGKLCVVIDYALENGGDFPSDKHLRGVGHDIEKLVAEMRAIRSRYKRDSDTLSSYPDDPITQSIISCLSEFAEGSRYYNLDFLVEGKGLQRATGDPLAVWFEQVSKPLLVEHYPEHRQKSDIEKATKLGAAIERYTHVQSWSESGDEINDVTLMIAKSSETRYLQRWTPFYLCRVFRFTTMLLKDLSTEAMNKRITFIPWMGDHFGRFVNEDSFLKTHKVWRYW